MEFSIPPSAVLEQTEVALPEPAAPQPAPREANPRKPALPALTGLRAILAVNIMLFHFTPPHIGPLRRLVDNAFVFVGFFFLISGFVLAYNYADRPSLSKRAFYLARFSRVYPVYLFALVISIPFLVQEWHAHSPNDFYLGVILSPLTLQGWSPLLATFWNTVAWTLPAEMMLYAIFPFMLLGLAALFRGPLRRFDSIPWLIAAMLCVWVLGIMPHTFYFFFNPDHLTEPVTRYTYAYWLRAIKYTPPFYLCTFTAGVLLSRLHAALSLTPRRRSLLALIALTGLALFFAFAVNRVPYIFVHGALLLPLFATLLIGLAGPNPVSSFFAWTPLVRFGETTFALYLLHFNVYQMIHTYHLPERLHIVAFDPWISYVAIILLAFAVHSFYEKPARRIVMNIFSPKP